VFSLIAAEKANYPVAVMCRVLGVNRTSFHDWERRPPSDRVLTDAWLTEKIEQIHADSRGVYGAPRIHAELRLEHGIRVGRKRVARLMKAAAISGVRPRKRWRTTIRLAGVQPATDLVERDFHPAGPNVLWVADITYLRSGEGWLYLAAVQDTYSRAIVGWSMATHMRASLVVDALQMALGRRHPGPGLIHHSDQGSHYVSLAFGRAARQAGIAISMGLPRRRLRQRRRRDVLRHAQERARQPPQLAVEARAPVRRVRIHRSVLQPSAPSLHARHGLPGRVRADPDNGQIHQNQTTNDLNNPCRPNRGRSGPALSLRASKR
jgi:putative transposase